MFAQDQSALACRSLQRDWAVSRLTAQPILGSALRTLLLRCMHGSQCRTIVCTADHVCSRFFLTLLFPSRARRRGKDSAPNEQGPICDAAVVGAKGAFMLVVVGSKVERDAVIHVCDSREGCGLFAWAWCMLVWFDEMSTTRAAGSLTGIGRFLSISVAPCRNSLAVCGTPYLRPSHLVVRRHIGRRSNSSCALAAGDMRLCWVPAVSFRRASLCSRN
jgi:hypothetical protein